MSDGLPTHPQLSSSCPPSRPKAIPGHTPTSPSIVASYSLCPLPECLAVEKRPFYSGRLGQSPQDLPALLFPDPHHTVLPSLLHAPRGLVIRPRGACGQPVAVQGVILLQARVARPRSVYKARTGHPSAFQDDSVYGLCMQTENGL